MARFTFLLLLIFLLACSPYKKVVLTMGEQQTARWKGASEEAVLDALGEYKNRTPETDGYSLLFDYTVSTVSKLSNDKNGFSVRAGTQPNQGLVPRENNGKVYDPSVRTYNTDQKVKVMKFNFDASHHVRSVYTEGYPDSVYYVKRK